MLRVTIAGQPVAFTNEYPAERGESQLFNSRCWYASGGFGSILAQHLDGYGFGVLYTLATIEEETDLVLTLPEPAFFCHINISGSVNILRVKEDTYQSKRNSASLAFSSLSGYTLHLKRGDYRAVTVIYPVAYVKKELLRFPSLEEWREKLKREQQWVLPNAIAPIFAAIANCIYEMLHVPRMFFTEGHHRANGKRLLREVFRYLGEKASPQPLTTLSDVDAVRKAKDWLDTNLDKHITIAGLAKKLGTNEFKLKKGFKQAFGIGVYGYHLRQRLLIAKEQLEQTGLPIREIARQAGYKKAVNFSTAFKRVHGLTPIQHRRQHNM